MNRIFSMNFWVQAFVSTFITMTMIYLIKKVNEKVNIPVVSDIVDGV